MLPRIIVFEIVVVYYREQADDNAENGNTMYSKRDSWGPSDEFVARIIVLPKTKSPEERTDKGDND